MFSSFTTAELRARGETTASIRLAITLGLFFRVIKGRYATSASLAQAVLAMRMGGRLGCVSALELYGARVPSHAGTHAVFPTAASGRRSAHLESRSESGIESIVRHLLAVAGITTEVQAVMRSRDRLDLGVGGWLAIEADGRETHAKENAFTADRDRVVRLIRQGRITLRFPCATIMCDPDSVVQAVRDVTARFAPIE